MVFYAQSTQKRTNKNKQNKNKTKQKTPTTTKNNNNNNNNKEKRRREDLPPRTPPTPHSKPRCPAPFFQSAVIGHAIKEALLISAHHLSTEISRNKSHAVNSFVKFAKRLSTKTAEASKHSHQHRARPPRVKRISSVADRKILVLFVLARALAAAITLQEKRALIYFDQLSVWLQTYCYLSTCDYKLTAI